MAVKKKRAKKTKKEIVKKQKTNIVVEKKPEVAPLEPQAPISESVGGPVVIPSSQSEPELPKAEPSASVLQPTPQPTIQPTPQAAGIPEVSQPESATKNIPSVEPIATQDPFAVDGVVRDKPEQERIEEPKKKWSWMIVGFITVVIIFIVGVLWYFRENAIKQVSLEDKITLTPSPSRISPTPATDSAKLAIDYSKYKIKVLNGSGIGGAAAEGKEILESEKFIVEEIGNAETSDYDLTIIQTKKEIPKAFLDKLKSVLEKTYKIAPNEELEDTEEVDVVVIIGSGRQP